MIEPLRFSFEVECPQEHAFETWTKRIGTWWPKSHSVTGDEDLEVVLEGRLGGRIFERTPAGTEHDWGEITIWEPPARGQEWRDRNRGGWESLLPHYRRAVE